MSSSDYPTYVGGDEGFHWDSPGSDYGWDGAMLYYPNQITPPVDYALDYCEISFTLPNFDILGGEDWLFNNCIAPLEQIIRDRGHEFTIIYREAWYRGVNHFFGVPLGREYRLRLIYDQLDPVTVALIIGGILFLTALVIKSGALNALLQATGPAPTAKAVMWVVIGGVVLFGVIGWAGSRTHLEFPQREALKASGIAEKFAPTPLSYRDIGGIVGKGFKTSDSAAKEATKALEAQARQSEAAARQAEAEANKAQAEAMKAARQNAQQGRRPVV